MQERPHPYLSYQNLSHCTLLWNQTGDLFAPIIPKLKNFKIKKLHTLKQQTIISSHFELFCKILTFQLCSCTKKQQQPNTVLLRKQ